MTLINTQKTVTSFLLALLIFSLLTNSNLFVKDSYTSLSLYLLIGSIVIILSGIIIIKQKDLQISKLPALIICIAFLWSIYVYINDNYINLSGGRLKSNFLMVSIVLSIALMFYLNKLENKKQYIFLFFSIVAGIESIWCIIQFITSVNASFSFKVTGSWINPNITAMYLALTLPYIILNVVSTQKEHKQKYLTLLIMILISLVLLKSRTAILGSILVAICILEWRYGKIKSFLKKTTRLVIIAISLASIILIGFIGFITYQVKKDSADGRKLIWNLSVNMIPSKPLTGFGYGSFEKNYNIEQARYFENFSGDDNEIVNASHTSMAYNEFIENTVEGGILGGIFFLTFLFLLLSAAYKFIRIPNYPRNTKLANSHLSLSDEMLLVSSLVGIITVAAMSLVNFTITAIPIMCIFIFQAAIIGNLSFRSSRSFVVPLAFNRILATALIVLGSYFFYKSNTLTYSQIKISNAVNAAKEKDYTRALNILKNIPQEKQIHENYHQVLGTLYYEMDKKPEALAVYQEATSYYSSPELYQQIGNCLLAKKDYNEAAKNYEIAKNIQPNRFTPRYLLMRLYVELEDKPNTIRLAKEIVEMEEKVPSELTAMYKKSANEVLKRWLKNT